MAEEEVAPVSACDDWSADVAEAAYEKQFADYWSGEGRDEEAGEGYAV